MTKVCLVIGAGAGSGGNVAKKFAREGYHAALCRRSDEEGMNKLVSAIEDEGGSATRLAKGDVRTVSTGKIALSKNGLKRRRDASGHVSDGLCARQ